MNMTSDFRVPQVLFKKLRQRSLDLGDMALRADPNSSVRDNFLHEVAGINDAIEILISVCPELKEDEYFHA